VDTIFVQIASYKDPELPKTIADCLSKATYPERLRFGICWQKTESEKLGKYLEDRRFRVHTVPWEEAKGVGWARSICNSLYQYENYTLQIDSHHRFAKGWDVSLIQQWKACNHPKAVLSGYPPGYEYTADGKEVYHNLPPMTMVVKGFDYGFVPTFKSWHVANTQQVKAPFRGCFIAAGFIFTLGKVCEEIPYAKEVYFTGEEILYSLRFFTHGYRIFYPEKWVIWHWYERKNSERHWDDFLKKDELKKEFSELQKVSMDTLKGALAGDPAYAKYFGKVNTLTEFECYSGVSIPMRVIHPKMLKGYEPPFATTRDWIEQVKPLKEYRINLDLNVSDIPDRDDYTFWYFGLHDKDCNELHREDVRAQEGEPFKKGPKKYTANLMLREKPVKYILWPHSKEKTWHDRLVYDIPETAITSL
jgi:hypothetical protein